MVASLDGDGMNMVKLIVLLETTLLQFPHNYLYQIAGTIGVDRHDKKENIVDRIIKKKSKNSVYVDPKEYPAGENDD